MQKSVLSVAATIAILWGRSVWAEDVSASLSQVLSRAYGAEVEAQTSADQCRVRYPQVAIEDEVVKYKDGDNSETTVETETVVTTVAETEAECLKIDDFKNYPQYKIRITSPNKLKAQIYNNFKLAFIKDIAIKEFVEEIDVVPALNFIRSNNLQLNDVSYTETDATTGLKSEIGNLKNYQLNRRLYAENGKIIQDTDMSLEALNLVLPFFSLQIKSEKQIARVEYTEPTDGEFDYMNMINNLPHLLSAKSSATSHGIKIGADMFGLGISFDTEIKNNVQRTDKDTVYALGSMMLKNISFNGDLLEKSSQPKAVTLKFAIQDIPSASFNKLSKIPVNVNIDIEDYNFNNAEPENKTPEEDTDYGLMSAQIMDEIAEAAKLSGKTEIAFENADITVDYLFERRNNFLHGTAKIKVTNLFDIFPKQKRCLSNPAASVCNDNFLFTSLRDLIDTTQNNSETVYRFEGQGVFKDNKKIADPVELNFEKMYRESQKEEDKIADTENEQTLPADKDSADSLNEFGLE